MCKIMVMSGIKPDKVKLAWEFTEKITPKIALSERDGIGYAAIKKDGTIISERWKEGSKAFKEKGLSSGDEKLISQLKGLVKGDIPEYNSHGNVSEKSKAEVVAITLHGRTATTPKSLQNVHPFIRKDIDKKHDMSLIHNGVIGNHEKLQKLISTCDSEVILNEYADYDINKSPELFQNVADALEGSYACAILSVDANNVPYMDVFRTRSYLYCTYVTELETTVFCTSKMNLEETIKELGWEVNTFWEFNEDHLLRLNAITGNKMDALTFKANTQYTRTYTQTGRSVLEQESEEALVANIVNRANLSNLAITETSKRIAHVDKHFGPFT